MGFSPQAFMRGMAQRLLPARNADSANQDIGARFGTYGELDIVSRPATKGQLAQEGSYFVARTPTPGTGVSSSIRTTFSDTVPLIQIYNQDALKTVELDYLKLIVTVAGASGTTFQMAGKLDTGPRSPTTNNTTVAVPAANNLGVGAKSVCQVLYQSSATASAIPAASTAAIVAFEVSLGGITIVGDELVLQFGKTDSPGGDKGGAAAQATCPGTKVTGCPPVIIAPQTNLTIYQWGAGIAITALSYSFELGLIER